MMDKSDNNPCGVDLPSSDTDNNSAANEAVDTNLSSHRASTSSTNDDIESGSSNSSKKGRNRRRKRDLYRKIRDQVCG